MSQKTPLSLKESDQWEILLLRALPKAELWLNDPTSPGKDTQNKRKKDSGRGVCRHCPTGERRQLDGDFKLVLFCLTGAQ